MLFRSARHRAQHHELVEGELAVVPVAARQAELALQVGGQQQLRGDHLPADAGRVALEHAERALEERAAREEEYKVISSRTLDELSAMARLAAGLRSQLATQPMIGSQEPYDHIQDAGGG